MKLPLVICLSVLLGTCTLWCQTVLEDGFESGSLAPHWGLSEGVIVSSFGGARNSINSARLSGYTAAVGRELGARFDSVAPEGVRDFTLDFYFRTRSTAERQFHLHVSTSTGPTGSSAPALSLRYQGGWQAYDGTAWRSIPELGTGGSEMWHRARVTGQQWGSPGARWAVQFAPAGHVEFAGAATNLTWFQGGNPTIMPARFFAFTTLYGNNPGFDVDEVFASVSDVVPAVSNAIVSISGTYPHLAVFSNEGEAGIGAVMPWADRLWFITYPPHNPNGGADKLWMVDSNLTLTAHSASVGGTHANRMIHRESQQMIIGPYFVDTNANVRVVPPSRMPGRLTGNARHLTDPTNKLYFASMEEGFYSVNVNTLAVEVLKADVQAQTSVPGMAIPGNHGKGLYSGQGRLIYANNGEPSWSIGTDPRFEDPAGLLAEISSTDYTNSWNTVERKTFTEITGPGGLMGNTSVDDPVWAIGWDKRSVLLKTLHDGVWHDYRLPKGSYTHDAFHGWYTEWPRIREVVPGTCLMHMHGLFYRFPGTFRPGNTAGLEPICTYLRMPVDYCWWKGQLVMARDDASTTGGNTWAGQSHSAPWFGQLSDLRSWGTPAGFGGLWLNDSVSAQVPSVPFLINGFSKRVLHLRNDTAVPLDILLQHDSAGQGNWMFLENVTVPKHGYRWYVFPASLDSKWLRLVPHQASSNISAYLHLSNPPQVPSQALRSGFAGADSTNELSAGIIRPQSGDARTLQFAAVAQTSEGLISAYYEINGSMELRRATNALAEQFLRTNYSLASQPFSLDGASVIYMEGTNRFRLPRGSGHYDQPFAAGWPRAVREVVTERRLLNVHGTFYELPLASSGGFRRIRPISTHNLQITDFASWRGLFVATGVADSVETSEHIFRSNDDKVGLWFGNVDDLWRFGAPAGYGGPWKSTGVLPTQPSDPYLMLGYEHKVLDLSHDAQTAVVFTIEVDFLGDKTWSEYSRFTVGPGETLRHVFPAGYSAHWVRIKSDTATTASALFTYGVLPQLTGWSFFQGEFQLTFTGSAGQPYTVLRSENIAEPLGAWTRVATGSFTMEWATWQEALSPGSTQQFFRISSGL